MCKCMNNILTFQTRCVDNLTGFLDCLSSYLNSQFINLDSYLNTSIVTINVVWPTARTVYMDACLNSLFCCLTICKKRNLDKSKAPKQSLDFNMPKIIYNQLSTYLPVIMLGIKSRWPGASNNVIFFVVVSNFDFPTSIVMPRFLR